jgi:hypothetical protein
LLAIKNRDDGEEFRFHGQITGPSDGREIPTAV